MKKEKKIRQILDYKEYHLHTSIKFELNEKITTWKLFKKYNGWISDGSEPIMTSETHTEEELLEFAKKHKKYYLVDITRMLLIIPIVTFIMSIINMCVNNDVFRGIVWGLEIATILILIIEIFIVMRNDKVQKLEFKEYLERIYKERK